MLETAGQGDFSTYSSSCVRLAQTPHRHTTQCKRSLTRLSRFLASLGGGGSSGGDGLGSRHGLLRRHRLHGGRRRGMPGRRCWLERRRQTLTAPGTTSGAGGGSGHLGLTSAVVAGPRLRRPRGGRGEALSQISRGGRPRCPPRVVRQGEAVLEVGAAVVVVVVVRVVDIVVVHVVALHEATPFIVFVVAVHVVFGVTITAIVVGVAVPVVVVRVATTIVVVVIVFLLSDVNKRIAVVVVLVVVEDAIISTAASVRIVSVAVPVIFSATPPPRFGAGKSTLAHGVVVVLVVAIIHSSVVVKSPAGGSVLLPQDGCPVLLASLAFVEEGILLGTVVVSAWTSGYPVASAPALHRAGPGLVQAVAIGLLPVVFSLLRGTGEAVVGARGLGIPGATPAGVLTVPELAGTEVPHRHGPSRAFLVAPKPSVPTRPLRRSLRRGRERVGVQVAVTRGGGGRATVRFRFAAVRVLGPVADLGSGVEVQTTGTAHRVLLVADANVEDGGVDGVADVDSLKTPTAVGFHPG